MCEEDIIKEYPFLTYKKRNIKKKSKLEKQRKICRNKEYNQIYQFITEYPISLNQIYYKSNKDIAQINNILLMLELEGYIEKVVGGYVCILDKK